MSGVSLAVAPRSDPDRPASKQKRQHQQKMAGTGVGGGSVMGSLRVIELQLVAFIVVFSASGLVPLLDLAFPAFASLYLLGLSRFAFPSHPHHAGSSMSPEIFQAGSIFRLYVIIGTTIGLFLPLAYVLGGFARGDNHAVRSATPHLFLLSFQILTENVIRGLSLFSPPVRALVPVLYTARRIFIILDWIADVWINKNVPPDAHFKDVTWAWFGKVLAVANLAYFSINLLFFLIPRFLPKAFERYFKERDEVYAKMAEDRQSQKLAATQPSSQCNRKGD